MICILDDDDARVRQFVAAAGEVAPDLAVRVWRSAPEMIADLYLCLGQASIISLDHDLIPLPTDAADPGSGYDVVKLLTELIPCCPIIIHTSNAERGRWMLGELARTQWQYDRVYPSGDDWIHEQWARLVRRRLGRE